MENKLNILGTDISNNSIEDEYNKIVEFLENDGTNVLISVDGDIIIEAQENLKMAEALKAADVILPEGEAVYWSALYMGQPFVYEDIVEELLVQMLNFMSDNKKTLYIVAETYRITELYKSNIKVKYPNINIVGTFEGDFNTIKEDNIINDINIHTPDLLIVDLEETNQQKWVCVNKNKLNVKLSISGGISFKSIIGYYPEPNWITNNKLKWLYRILASPNGIKKLFRNSQFKHRIKQHVEKGKKNGVAK